MQLIGTNQKYIKYMYLVMNSFKHNIIHEFDIKNYFTYKLSIYHILIMICTEIFDLQYKINYPDRQDSFL